jgi:hypothetical protein
MEPDRDQISLFFDHAVLVVAELGRATRHFQGMASMSSLEGSTPGS